MKFLQENPDKRPSYGSQTTPASFAAEQSGGDIEAAVQRNIDATMGGGGGAKAQRAPMPSPAAPNVNDQAQSALTDSIGMTNDANPGTPAQANVQEPARQPLPDIGDGQQHFAGDPSLSSTAMLAPAATALAAMGAMRGQGARVAPKAMLALPAPAAMSQLAAPEAVAMLPPPARQLPAPNAGNRPPLPANEQRSREVINRRNTEADKMKQGADTAIPMSGPPNRTGAMNEAIAARKKTKSKSKSATPSEDAVGAGR